MKKLMTLQAPRVLMMGYNGANNTGAEALLSADIEDVRAVMGPDARITVPTLNEANLRRYVRESSNLRIAPMPTIYFGAIRRMVKESDLVLLVEGSTYMDSWGSPLLWAFLWATKCAFDMGKPVLAYAVDSGSLSKANTRRVRKIASLTDLIVTRNRAAADCLRRIGVTARMESTADNALVFKPRESDIGWVAREWDKADTGIVGLAMVDFSLFPVVMRPWGPKDRCYKWPFYFVDSKERRQASELLAASYATLADSIVAKTGKAVALICMEQLDEPLARDVFRRMKHTDNARIFSAREHDASRMTTLLRGLDLLITSRFHAAILSLAAGVPQAAFHHDTRLASLYTDLWLMDEWFVHPGTIRELASKTHVEKLFEELQNRANALLDNPGLQKSSLDRGYAEHLARAERNRKLLAEFVSKHIQTPGKNVIRAENENQSIGGAA
jgi:polysaccharide pyruvyl transferase WcaK-like protein